MTRQPAGRRSWFTVLRDGAPVAAALELLAMAYWRCGGGRRGDVFLCSYPKSGRTWLRFLLTAYQLRLVGADFGLTLRNLPELSPNVTLFSAFRLRDPPVDLPRRILGTHTELAALYRGLPRIVLRRDLRDVLVSYYWHRVAHGEFHGDLEAFVESPWGWRRAVRYHNRWCRALAGLPAGAALELTYEGLHADTEGVLRRCLRFLDLDVRDRLVAEAVAEASAENMRRLEARWGTPDFSAERLKRDESAFHVRQARVGGHRRELSPDAAARLGATLRDRLLDPCGYDYGR